MSKVITSDMATHLAGAVTSLAMCWKVTRTDDVAFYFTNHDQDLVVDGHTYVASTGFQQTAITNATGLSVANLEVDAILDSSAITLIDLRAGKFDFAKIEIFLVNWKNDTVLVPIASVGSFDTTGNPIYSSQDAVFSSDGTKMYVTDYGLVIQQFTLSTPWDITTASYDSVFLDTTATVNESAISLKFNADGTSLYIASYDTSIVWQYTLITPWDLSSADVPPAYNFDSQINNWYTSDWEFKDDGSKLYFGSTQFTRIYQYSLGSAYDISTTSSDGIDQGFSVQVSNMVAFKFKADGSKIYVADGSSNKVYQYTLGTPWVISTATYDTVSFDSSSQVGQLQSLRFKPDGTKMYLASMSGDTIYQYTLGTAWELSTATYASKSFNTSSQLASNDLFAFNFSPDGLKLFAGDNSGITVYQYALSVAWDISTASYSSISATFGVGYFTQIQFNDDGTHVYISDNSTSAVVQYDLGTPWDLSSVVITVKAFDTSGVDSDLASIAFNGAGTKMYVGTYNDLIYQYTLATPDDISTASYDSISFSVSTEVIDGLQAVVLSPDGAKLFMSDYSNTVFQYSLSSAGDLSSAVYDNVYFDASNGFLHISATEFSADGLNMYIIDWYYNFVYQYVLASPFDLTAGTMEVPNADGKIQLRTGRIGEVAVTQAGMFKSELRGLSQQYSQQIIELYTPDCRTDLGSSKCKIPIEPPLRTNSTLCIVGANGNPGTTIRVATTSGTGSQVYENVYYECTTAGTTGVSAPTYDPVVGHTTSETGFKATNVLTFNSQPGNTTTINAGGKIYTFQSTLTNVDGHVKIGATDVDTCANLLAALTLGAGSGTAYAAATTANANIDFTSASSLSINFIAKTAGYAGNAIVVQSTTFGAVFLSGGVSATTLSGGVDGAVFTARNAWSRAAVVASVTDNKTFSITVTEPRAVDDWFTGGVFIWESGNNVGETMEIKSWVNSGSVLTLYLGMPFAIQVGDVGRLYPGCDKRSSTCIARFNNINNFRGEPYVPGQDLVFSYPNAK